MLKLLPLWMCGIIAITFFSCTENLIEEEAPPAGPGWQLASGFAADNMTIRNSTVSDGQLYVVSDKYLSVVQKNGSASHSPHGETIPFALPLTSDYFVALERNPDVLVFVPTANPSHPNAKRIRIKPSDLGTDIFGVPQFNNQRAFAMNDKGQMMTIFLDKASKPVFFLFDVVVERDDTLSHIKAVNYRRITVPSILSSNIILNLGDNFLIPITSFFSVENRTLLIEPNASMTTASKDLIYKVIDLDSIQFAVGSNGFYESQNKGFSWTLINSSFDSRGLAFQNLSIMQGYTKIGNQFVLYTPSQISTIESPKGAFYGRRNLNLDGLDNSWIIGVYEWGGRVFAVTEKGVYMRTIGSFFR